MKRSTVLIRHTGRHEQRQMCVCVCVFECVTQRLTDRECDHYLHHMSAVCKAQYHLQPQCGSQWHYAGRREKFKGSRHTKPQIIFSQIAFMVSNHVRFCFICWGFQMSVSAISASTPIKMGKGEICWKEKLPSKSNMMLWIMSNVLWSYFLLKTKEKIIVRTVRTQHCHNPNQRIQRNPTWSDLMTSLHFSNAL